MTYGGQTSDRDKIAKQNIEQSILESVRKQLEVTELTVEADTPKYTCSRELANSDCYKLMRTINEEERVAEINDVANSKIIVGAIEIIDENNRTMMTMGKMVFCLDNDLIEGMLIIAGNKLPHYAECQKDDIVRSSTIGKVIQIYHDRCIYFNACNEQCTSGEYDLSKTKRLQLSNNPVIVRRPATPERSRPATLRTALTRRPSVSSQASLPTPRTILRYKLVRYI